MKLDEELLQLKAELLGSFILFTKVFYKLRTGRDFIISQPIGRESHHITISRAFTKVLSLDIQRLIINIEPGSGKSELCKHFVAWALAHHPDSNFLYISYSHELASKHTYGIKQIVTLPMYRDLFGIEILRDSSAKDNFKTNAGGVIYASGSSGSITGQDAGLPHLNRFSGAIIIDDIHKPDEVHSDTIREGVKQNYFNTIIHRLRGTNVPILFIGQRLHEDDLAANLKKGVDGYQWDEVILKSIDGAGNALYPEVHPKEQLMKMQETSPYEYASQYQQDPQPAGGGIFKKDWFLLLDEEPKCLVTFIVCDTAESAQDYSDHTVFTFYGLYKVKHGEIETDTYALHVLDCWEIKIEPKDLKPDFMQFWADCMKNDCKPRMAVIEKKSSGSTLISLLKEIQGLQIIELKRTKETGSKTARFLRAQPYVARKQISLPRYGKHTHSFIEHMGKITANETHRYDDIADTLADAIQLALIDKTITYTLPQTQKIDSVVRQMAAQQKRINDMRVKQWQR